MCTSCCREIGWEDIDSDGEEDPYARDMIILRNMMSRVNSITLAVTVSFPDGKVRATIPEHITPTHTCLKDLISAFKGKTKGLESRVICIEGAMPGLSTNQPIRYIPGKMDENRVLYCVGSDNKEGDGCVVYKTNRCLLIAGYYGNRDESVRVIEETGRYMIENDL